MTCEALAECICGLVGRVVLVSAVSPVECSRKPKAASPAMAAPPTGQTEECFLFGSQKASGVPVCVKLKQKQTHYPTMGNLAPPHHPKSS